MIAEILEFFRTHRVEHVTRDLTAHPGAQYVVLGEELLPVTMAVRSRAHTYTSLEDFCEHLNRHHDPAAADVLFDGSKRLVVASSDPNRLTADGAKCTIPFHPRWNQWAAIIGQKLSHKAMFRALMGADKADGVPYVDGAGKVVGMQHVELARAIQSVQVTKNAGMTQELDDYGNTRLRSTDQKNETNIRVPPTIAIRCPIYQLEAAMYHEVELAVEVDTESGVSFTLHAPGLPLVLDQANAEVLEALRARLKEGFLVGRGVFATEERKV